MNPGAEAAVSVKSAAYHEAGHMVTAAAQGLPLKEKGMFIYENSNGLGEGWAYYKKRPKGSQSPDFCGKCTIFATNEKLIPQRLEACSDVSATDGLSADDPCRFCSLLAALAGQIAQQQFYTTEHPMEIFPHDGSVDDRTEFHASLDELYCEKGERQLQLLAQDKLSEWAQKLVQKHWRAIDELAKELLKAPWRPSSLESTGSGSPPRLEKRMTGQEVRECLRKSEIFIEVES